MRAAARAASAGDVADVVQPVAGLGLRPVGKEFQQQRQVVRQLARVELEAVAAVRIHQVHHRLAAVARFAVDMLEQQQAHRAAAIETAQPARLRIERIAVQQRLHEAAQLPLARRRKGRVVARGQQLRPVLPQFVARVVQQYPDQLEQAHSTTSCRCCRFGCTA